MRYSCVLFVSFLVFSSPLVAQQQPQYSQFMFNNLVINPAYAGAEEALSLTMLNRNQWMGVEGAPVTQSFGLHTLLPKDKIGLGISVIYDKLGVHKNLSALSNYAYHIRFQNDAVISFGLQVGVHTLNSDYTSLLGSSNDPKLMNRVSEAFVDIGSGIYFRTPRLQLGVSANRSLSNQVQLKDTLSTVLSSTNFFGYGRYQFPLSKKFDLQPGLLVKYFPDTPLSYDINLNFVYSKVLTTGVSYRKDESVDFILRFQLTTKLQLGYAYDYPLNDASRLSNASHELMIQYVFRNVHKNVTSPR